MTTKDDPPGDDNTETTPSHRSQYSSNSLSVDLVYALEQHPDITPDLLYNHLDPDALDDLFAPTCDGTQRSPGHVSFSLDGYWITVKSDHTIEIEPDRGKE